MKNKKDNDIFKDCVKFEMYNYPRTYKVTRVVNKSQIELCRFDIFEFEQQVMAEQIMERFRIERNSLQNIK